MDQRQLETDVFIIGAGPAGLAAGIAARRKGFNVVIADSARPPIDKACGEGLMPDALAALNRLGVALPIQAGYPFTGIRFICDRSKATANFPSGFGMGIRRTKLHEILVQSAHEAGASILWGATVGRSPTGSLLIDGTPLLCRWVIGADGQNSRVRSWAGIHSYPGEQIRFGFRCHFRIQPWTDCVEVYWGRGCQVFVTPVGPAEVCVALLTRDSRAHFDVALSQFPELNRRLVSAIRTTALRGALSVQRTLRAVVNGKFILIGDGSGSVDAITGEGLCLSFRQAECLAEALVKNDLELYRRGHRRIQRVASVMARLMISMDRFHFLRVTIIQMFENYPAVFSAFLARHLEAKTLAPSIREIADARLGTPDASKC